MNIDLNTTVYGVKLNSMLGWNCSQTFRIVAQTDSFVSLLPADDIVNHNNKLQVMPYEYGIPIRISKAELYMDRNELCFDL